MTRDRIFSRKFLGITLVPFGTRPRIVTKAVFAHGYHAALCGKNKVVISSDECFRHSFDRSDYAQHQVANVLLALEVISQETHNDFARLKKAEQTNKAREKMKARAEELDDLMNKFGMTLSELQRDRVNSMLKIEAA